MSVGVGMERGVWNQAHLAGFPASPVTFVTGLDKDGSSFVSSGVQVVWSCPSHRIKYPTLVVVCFRSVGFGEWSGCRASNVSEAQQCLLSSAVSTSDAAWIEGRLWWAGWLCKLRSILLMESCYLCNRSFWGEQQARAFMDSQNLTWLTLLTNLKNQELSRSKQQRKILFSCAA